MLEKVKEFLNLLEETINFQLFKGYFNQIFWKEWFKINLDLEVIFINKNEFEKVEFENFKEDKILYLPSEINLWEIAYFIKNFSILLKEFDIDGDNVNRDLMSLGERFINTGLFLKDNLNLLKDIEFQIASKFSSLLIDYGNKLLVPFTNNSFVISKNLSFNDKIEAFKLLNLMKGTVLFDSDFEGVNDKTLVNFKQELFKILVKSFEKNEPFYINDLIKNKFLTFTNKLLKLPEHYFIFLILKIVFSLLTNLKYKGYSLKEWTQIFNSFTSEKKISLISEIIEYINSDFSYVDDEFKPVSILKSKKLNCVGASLIASAIFDNWKLPYGIFDVPEHSIIVVVIDEKLYYLDILNKKFLPIENSDLIVMNVNSIIFYLKNEENLGMPVFFKKSFLLKTLPWLAERSNLPFVFISPALTALSVQLISWLGYSYSKLNKNIEAIKFYQKAIEIDPNYVDAYYGLGYSYSKLNKNIEAIKFYQKAIEIDPNYVDAYYGLGLSFYQINNKEKAINYFNKYLSLVKNKKIDNEKIKEVENIIFKLKY